MPAHLRKILLLAAGLAPVLLIYAVNPNNRVYSFHGLCHGAITYQIANGIIPPENPFLAGYPLRYYWGYHLLGGLLTRAFEITPFYAFAVINVLSLLISLGFVFRTSQLLLPDAKAGVSATFVALYASTGINFLIARDLLIPRFEALSFIDWRGVPAFQTFMHLSGIPLGIALFSVVLYTLTGICRSRFSLARSLLLLAALAACGFLYPPMFPGLIAVSGAAWAATAWVRRELPARRHAMRLLGIGAICAGAVLIVWPYLSAITTGYAEQVRLSDPRYMLGKTFNAAVLSLPIGCIVFVGRRELIGRCNHVALAVIAAASGSTALMYLVLGQTFGVEYKNLVLSMVGYGILGGTALFLGRERWGRVGLAIVCLLLLSNPVYEIAEKWNFRKDKRRDFVEHGRDLSFPHGPRAELFRWIRESTPEASVFIDRRSWMPILGQRALFVIVGPVNLCGIHPYNMFNVDDVGLVKEREQLARALLAGQNLTAAQRRHLAGLERPLYLVDPAGDLESRLDPREWKLVFRTENGRDSVFRFGQMGSPSR